MKKLTFKPILAIVLSVIIVAGSIGGYFALTHQPAAQVIDQTIGQSAAPEEEGEEKEIPTRAVLSQNVVQFSEAESAVINDSILSLESLASGVEMEIENGSAMENMGVGDIFFLEGDENTPFGMTYIGKVGAVMPGEMTDIYTIETPTMDEVFDVFSFSEEGMLSPENLKSVECAPGVSLVGGEQVNLDSYPQEGQIVNLSKGGSVQQLKTVEGKGQLLFELKTVDLAELLGLKDKKKPTKNEKVDFMQAGSVTVYTTNVGKRYHKESCFYLNSSKNSIDLGNALDKGYTPCKSCNPPIRDDDEGLASAESSLTLGGQFGIKDLVYSATCNWDLINGGGLEDLWFDVNGTFVAGIELNGNLEFEFSGRTTAYKLSDDIAFEGLKERLVPLVAMHYVVGTSMPQLVEGGNKEIRNLTSPIPLSIIGIVYVDGHGKLTLGFNAHFNYERPFTYNKTIVRGGKFCYDDSFDKGTPKIDAGVEFEVTADADIQVGCGLDLYIFNLKVLQLDIAQLGVEAQGGAKLQYGTAVANGEEKPFDWDAHVEGYFRLLQLKLGLQAKLDIIPGLLEAGFDANYEFLLWNLPLFTFGKKDETRFDASTMSSTHVTAKDKDVFFYKDTEGKLIVEQDGYRETLWADNFFTICGIDESYIYILESGEGGTHNLRRVARDGKTSKIVAEDVAHFLMYDETYMYFVSGFDDSVVKRLNRGTEKIDNFANFDDKVGYMEEMEDGNIFVVVGENFFFFSSYNYYLLDKDGNTIKDYGEEPDVSELCKEEFENYDVAIMIASGGYLRDSAQAVYWVGANGNYKEVPPLIGWNYFEGGIITMESGYGAGYNMVLYRAEDGAKVVLAQTNHDHAIFSTAQDENGRWYYLDQTNEEIILYTVSSDLTDRREIHRLSRSEFPVDLSNCSVKLVDGKLYFFSIVDEKECQVLYRYNIF